MTEPTTNNLKVIYSPTGERFEMSPPNFRDLVNHAGWTETPPHPDTVAAHIAKVTGTAAPETDDKSDDSTATDDAAEKAATDAAAEKAATDAAAEKAAADAAAEQAAKDAANEALRAEAERTAAEDRADAEDAGDEVEETSDERVLKLLPSDFADMDKPAVFSYIEKTFPGNHVDGRKGRDNLVAFAIDLAKAETGA